MQQQMRRPDLLNRLSPTMVEEDRTEVRISDIGVKHEANVLENSIGSLEIEIDGATYLHVKLAEKDAALDEMRKELMVWKKRVYELEAELEKKNESEKYLHESLICQTKQLELTKICLAESKLEVGILNTNEAASPKVDDEVELLKQKLTVAEEAERKAMLRAESLSHEVSLLKNELKLAMEVEEKGSRAMDDLASALKEVTTELSKVREELWETESEMEGIRSGVGTKEEKLKYSLDEARNEANQFKNIVQRLRQEAEETLIAWNEKEVGFISYVKKVDEERGATQMENKRLIESLLEAEKMTRMSKDETHKLRDVLKQALNEANVAKEAAVIAKRENSELKECLVEKDSALDFLTIEYEKLKQSEAAAREDVIELKKLLQCSLKPNEDEHNSSTSIQKVSKTMSFDLTELRMPKPVQTEPVADLDAEKAETLRGYIFDKESPSPPHVPSPAHNRKQSPSVYTDDSDTVATDEEFDHFDGPQFDEHCNRIKKRALLRRFGDLWIRKRVGHHHPNYKTELSSIELSINRSRWYMNFVSKCNFFQSTAPGYLKNPI